MWKRNVKIQLCWIFGWALAYLALPQELHVVERVVQGEPLDASAWAELFSSVGLAAAFIVGCGFAATGMIMWIAWTGWAGRPKGLAIAGPGFRMFVNGVLLLAGMWAGTLAMDAAWVGAFKQQSLLGLQPEYPGASGITALHFVSIPAMLVAWPLMSLYFTSLSGQVVEVTRAGVLLHGVIATSRLSWHELEDVRIREQRNPVGTTVADFRPLEKTLELEGDGVTLTIHQPTTQKRKRAILSALTTLAPEDKKNWFEKLPASW